MTDMKWNVRSIDRNYIFVRLISFSLIELIFRIVFYIGSQILRKIAYIDRAGYAVVESIKLAIMLTIIR